MMEPKKKFWRPFLLSGGVILGAMIAAAGGLYYLSGRLNTDSASIISDRNFIAEQANIVGTLASLKSAAAQSAPYLTAMQKLLPSHDQLVGFPNWINGLAAADGVTANVSFTGNNMPRSGTSPASDAFSLHVTGPMDGMVALLNDIEIKSSGFLVAIDTFNFSGSGGAGTLMAAGRVFSQ